MSPTTQPYLENATLLSGEHGAIGEAGHAALQTLSTNGTSRL